MGAMRIAAVTVTDPSFVHKQKVKIVVTGQ
jgi:hypothetical protein